ncbi:hypothetical protein C8A01DRAFT_35799 [Parachaetomium inaequale]|uniref:Uncharacterized protein n=1 Tax=Parachaetomium inaequale TaxID=2588326 RepID=A0AAN6PGH1_9PEZI|nr:hypothetical protein C8A01DRAFT_35799 [Parachaetomium inaequale]
MTEAPISNVSLPMQVHAFILNEAVADDPAALIAPITQPNYTFLRLDQQTIQADLLDHVDLHYASPRQNNSRVRDLGTGAPHTGRFGAYVSWVIPRAYRSGTAATKTDGAEDRRKKAGFPTTDPKKGKPDYSAPEFRAVPTRWLVVRHIDPTTVTTPPPGPPLSETEGRRLQCRAWVVESDRKWDLGHIAAEDDLQVKYSPYVAPSRVNAMSDVTQQAEVFIGNKTDISQWAEDDPGSPKDRIRPLTLLNSSNHLFADFQPHNSNVFSMLDDFSYTTDSGHLATMLSAEASYYVVGWHADNKEDPFYVADGVSTTHQIRTNALMMNVPGAGDGGPIDAWIRNGTSTSALCHGAVYGVAWNSDKAPANVRARGAADQLNKNKPSIPVSVGTTPTDALITYVAAHKDSDSDPIKTLEQDLWAIQTLLVAQDDGADAQLQAKDLLYSYGYERSDGGTAWHMSGADSGVEPTADQQTTLEALYPVQLALDGALRTVRYLRWQLFSVWWKYVSGALGNPVDVGPAVQASRVQPLVDRINVLLGTKPGQDTTNSIPWLADQQLKLSQGLPLEKGAAPEFYQKKDPTLMIGGIEAGWPVDYLDKLTVRLDFQLPRYDVGSTPAPAWSEFDGLAQTILAKLPLNLRATASSLLNEFRGLARTPAAVPDKGFYLPLYHDQGPPDPKNKNAGTSGLKWRDQWDGQPWFPLFVEWEADYFHIPFGTFDLSSRPQNDAAAAQSVLRYGIPAGTDLRDKVNDIRRLSGRILLLPQPSFSLKSAVTQLFRNMQPAQLDPFLDEGDRTFLLNNIAQLQYLSHTLSGVTDHLVTRVQGTHIKPNQRPPGEQLTAMKAAVAAGGGAGFTPAEVQLQDAETHVTPYGRSMAAATFDGAAGVSPLKPVTHGQLRFTALNVIDKFGQAICALDPTPVPAEKRPHIAPAVADVYVCQEDADGHPIVVASGIDPPGCEFVQLTPGINQPARLNAFFVTPTAPSSGNASPSSGESNGWRPVNSWENPIWGWAVVNYAEYALQLFLPDGTFYREIVHRSDKRATVSPAWSPFAKPNAATVREEVSGQLRDLVTQLADDAYLEAFLAMVDRAFALLPPAPASYAQYLNSIVGKPLALVNAGFSLELATPPLCNESTLNTTPEDYSLLPASTPVLPTGQDPATIPTPDPNRPQYSFKVQLGDKSRAYDGLLGFFKPPPPVSPPPAGTGPFDMSKLYTFWPTPHFPGTADASDATTFPSLPPYFPSPDTLLNPNGPNGGTNSGTALKPPSAITAEHNLALQPLACILDPFTPLHVYSDLLPIAALALPPWTVERALARMTAFFRVGPLLVPADVPALAGQELAKHVLRPGDAPGAVLQGSEVAAPCVGKARWAWLQPYYDPDAGGVKAGGAGGKMELVPPPYVALGVGGVDGTPRFEAGPYTAVEGFLRQTEPMASPGGKGGG